VVVQHRFITLAATNAITLDAIYCTTTNILKKWLFKLDMVKNKRSGKREFRAVIDHAVRSVLAKFSKY
jgi:hypothetical protein